MSDSAKNRNAILATFERRKSGSECPMCHDLAKINNHSEAAPDDVVAELPSGRVYLKNDAVYRGYCILIFHRHAVELADLTLEERRLWIEDIARIGEAITICCQPAKLNLSMLGNMVPHLHCHIMPRYPDDPAWGTPPTFDPDSHPQLPPTKYTQLHTQLYNMLKESLQQTLKENQTTNILRF